jgi:hypothetical protein
VNLEFAASSRVHWSRYKDWSRPIPYSFIPSCSSLGIWQWGELCVCVRACVYVCVSSGTQGEIKSVGGIYQSLHQNLKSQWDTCHSAHSFWHWTHQYEGWFDSRSSVITTSGRGTNVQKHILMGQLQETASYRVTTTHLKKGLCALHPIHKMYYPTCLWLRMNSTPLCLLYLVSTDTRTR